ncbi:hypothetical protein COX69_03995 [Candidatus Falkowbacteria bacterium CG_4_10_14_0_2_um_filter_48_10]|uniref:EamA domain-containing protein n=1 Tax=Candidatus Falkowbacteria bacterium CG23_combo_of_CG06-09_8_20_14_all_49_15 TaxID=1974572 RepID=A0A2G9ZMX7_9BACT|nr:MAG: hypothetical protein COX22_02995 [Candidatus Falkowbacteria bacterium CG23_combo_of_CG06-09_8_20_14_all_49_15]PJA07700.1 MAG: hypothetical protein COX69_03995 [Candidatus Falkowbacteria bacterium CG_4_10_14_0_2_um_filter_48_10]
MWLMVAIAAYLINAVVYVADKFILSKKIHSSVVYAFFVSIWSVFNLALLPFAFWIPSGREFGLDFLAGLLFLGTLIFWYKALHQSEATRVVPVVGALVPIFSLFLAFIFLGQGIGKSQFVAFTVLVIGGAMISVRRTRFYYLSQWWARAREIGGDFLGSIHSRYRPTRRLVLNSLIAAFFFAAYYVLAKHIFTTQPFIGAFVWSRIGTFAGALAILAVPKWREQIKEHQRGVKTPKNLLFFLLVRLAAAAAFIMLNWAISLGNVALVSALQGTQYLFLILLVFFLSAQHPDYIKEEMGRGVLAQKFFGALLVCLGLYLLLY